MLYKRIVFLLSLLIFFFQFSIFAQDTATVQWMASGKKIANGQYEIYLKGMIRQGWHVYAKANQSAGLEGVKDLIF